MPREIAQLRPFDLLNSAIGGRLQTSRACARRLTNPFQAAASYPDVLVAESVFADDPYHLLSVVDPPPEYLAGRVQWPDHLTICGAAASGRCK